MEENNSPKIPDTTLQAIADILVDSMLDDIFESIKKNESKKKARKPRTEKQKARQADAPLESLDIKAAPDDDVPPGKKSDT